MAYNGYLINIGGSDLLHQYILEKTYKVTKHVQDLDPYRDANGLLHRNALEHISYTVTFDIRSITNSDMESITTLLRNNYTVAIERKIEAFTFYVPEDNAYVTAPVYLVEPNFVIQHMTSNMIKYEPTTLEFIGY